METVSRSCAFVFILFWGASTLHSEPSRAQQFMHSVSTEHSLPVHVGEKRLPSLHGLEHLAIAITVKVLAGDSWGSGTLVSRNGDNYTVITNAHVLTPGEGHNFRILTMDGRLHPASRVPRASTNPPDLALLRFMSSSATYTTAILYRGSLLRVGTLVYAAGFPFGREDNAGPGFSFAAGHVALVPDRTFTGGYQIGYTNAVEKGMSGGPVLAEDGTVVAINGMHSYPLWGNPYVYEDGTLPTPGQQVEMRRLSWAIPATRVIRFLGHLKTQATSQPPSPRQPARPFLTPLFLHIGKMPRLTQLIPH